MNANPVSSDKWFGDIVFRAGVHIVMDCDVLNGHWKDADGNEWHWVKPEQSEPVEPQE